MRDVCRWREEETRKKRELRDLCEFFFKNDASHMTNEYMQQSTKQKEKKKSSKITWFSPPAAIGMKNENELPTACEKQHQSFKQ